jgi:hypothetical protein
VGAFVNAVLERPTATDVFAVPPSALHGGDRIYLISDAGRLRAVPVRRAGERREGRTLTLLVRPARENPTLGSGVRILATHLPHAIDGLAVEVIGVQQ